MTDHGLGRRPAADIRDREHLMAAHLGFTRLVLTERTWRYWVPGPVLDQGQTPQCVGYAWAQWLATSPVRTKDGPPATVIYAGAQQVDEFADTPPTGGTSVRAGAKIMRSDGRLGEYVWATSVAEVRDWLLTRGPVVLGTDWYEGMFDPDELGYVPIIGSIAGGHAYLCIGYSAARQAFRCVNSWGASWGQRGRFWLHDSALATLLVNGGEAVAGIEIAV